MNAMKKIEIIVEAVQLPYVIMLIEQLALPGYTIINGVNGRGESGVHDGQGLDETCENSYIMVICSAQGAEKLTSLAIPLINKYGGICISSDVLQVE
ncbi:MAG: hypothetical protein H6679_04460 [Epsilonproteobacteria bacterium]|nr:hypothetical protein [Campylobacterota bacterium]